MTLKSAKKSKSPSKPKQPKPVVSLSDGDGNAFQVLAACARAARKAGWKPERIEAFKEAAKAGDYDHLLQTAQKHFDVQ